MIKIRQLKQSDVENYRDIRLKMLKDNPESFGGSFEESSKLELDFFKNYISDNYIVGAFDCETLVGTMSGYLNKNNKTKHMASMFGVYIEENYLGLDILKMMLDRLIAILPDYVEQIKSSVTYTNDRAVKAYEKIGFENIGLEKKCLKIDGQYYDVMLIVKHLDKTLAT